jgi:hypothetical protein
MIRWLWIRVSSAVEILWRVAIYGLDRTEQEILDEIYQERLRHWKLKKGIR